MLQHLVYIPMKHWALVGDAGLNLACYMSHFPYTKKWYTILYFKAVILNQGARIQQTSNFQGGHGMT